MVESMESSEQLGIFFIMEVEFHALLLAIESIQSYIPTKGLEVPCTYIFVGKPLLIKKRIKIMTKVVK